MPHLLLQHKVDYFDTWKIAYDRHATARKVAGVTELHLLRGIADPNHVVILFHLADLERARAFLASDDLKTTMEKSGVVGEVQLTELQ